uniref:KLRAQ domain-containing protein n=1 Tax=Glossina brevipalpis TaxID=37001 RepID=A0A1A9W8B4_9MUSC
MEGFVSEIKYQKLAGEYAKLRAQASVLKRAVLDEQSKSSGLRDQLRQKESTLRRAEQEVDSLGFRNKQLEHRVAALQDELATNEGRKKDKDNKQGQRLIKPTVQQANLSAGPDGDRVQEALIFEELQKKIMETVQLTTLIDDKDKELQIQVERIRNLECSLEKRNTDISEVEKRLRREMEILQSRNSELETKVVEAASILESEDALSASGSDTTPLHNNQQLQTTAEERITNLEKEVAYWRSQYEISKLYDDSFNSNSEIHDRKENALFKPMVLNEVYCSCSTTAAGLSLSVQPLSADVKSARDSLKETPIPPTKEQLLFNNLSSKYEELLRDKHSAESHVNSYKSEVDHLQNCLENATQELKAKDEQIQSINEASQFLEEDLATTRVNYEEQISVLTEQVISLSEQLAACK